MTRFSITGFFFAVLLASSPVPAEDAVAVRARAIQAGIEACAGPAPAQATSPPKANVVSEEDAGSYLRQLLAIEVETGDKVPAYLLIPKVGSGAKLPAMLALHQTTSQGKKEVVGIDGKPNLAYGAELAERGYVVLAPDYPGFGDYQVDAYAMGYESTTMKGIFNHRRCIDYLVSLASVDAELIGCIGHSLGGHNTLFLGAFDSRVKVMVSSCGFTPFRNYYKGDLTGWTHKGYMPRIASVYFKKPELMPFDFPELLASLAPRAVFINAPMNDANFDVEGVNAAVEVAGAVFNAMDKGEKLVALTPDCEHDFPPEVREEAYEFIAAQWKMTE